MNERIKELYEQAHLVYEIPYESSVVDSTIVSTYKRKQFNAEKFAELIVRECATAIINDRRLNDVRSAANGCVRTINEHFGVEE